MRSVFSLSVAAIVLAACSARTDEPASAPAAPAKGLAAPPSAVPAAPEAEADPGLAAWRFLCAKYDRDGDGVLTRAEHTRGGGAFERLDADRDGRIAPADFDVQWEGMPRTENFSYGEGGPEFGDEAPNFRLTAIDGRTIELAQFRGQKAVALVFGSFT